jgi:hypothetical protein
MIASGKYWRTTDVLPPGEDIEVGGCYEMNIVGTVPRNGGLVQLPFGWLNDTRVFLPQSPEARPGDRVTIEISKRNPMSVSAEILESMGPFLPGLIVKENDFRIRLTGRSDRDLRDAVSVPTTVGGGLYGMFTIVQRARYQPPDNGIFTRNERIKVVEYKTAKTGQYYVVAELMDKSRERDLEHEIYIGEFSDGEPTLDSIQDTYRGVPRPMSPSLSIFFKSRREIAKVTRGGVRYLPDITPEKAIRYLYKNCFADKFKIVLAAPGTVSDVAHAAGNLGLKYETLDSVVARS